MKELFEISCTELKLVFFVMLSSVCLHVLAFCSRFKSGRKRFDSAAMSAEDLTRKHVVKRNSLFLDYLCAHVFQM